MMLIINEIILGILFLLISFVSFVTPFYPLIKKLDKNLDGLEKITISAILGLVIFTLIAYILSAVHLRFLMYAFPLAGIYSFFKYRKDFLNLRFGINNKKFFLTVFILGVIGMVLVNAPSGLPYKDGIYFWSSHGHDGVWHLALMENMHKDVFPFQNPELAGNKLQNYHFFVDLFMSEFSRLFPFSNLDIYFRFMPTAFAVLLGLSSFIFVRLWTKKELAGIWSMIFLYFAGSFGYLLYIPTHKALGGESIFWLSQTQSVLGNPPHASAFIVTIIFLFSLYKYLDLRNKAYFFLCVILGGAVIEFKVYAGLLILGGLLVVSIYELLFKRIYQVLLLFLTTLFVSLIIYLPNSANSQDFLIWQPWWYIRTMVVATDRLNWLNLELIRQTYVADHNWKRVIQVETVAFLIFLFGNLGMRFFGFWAFLKIKLYKNSFNIFLLSMTLASFLMPVFFLQKGVAWNSIQFNQYFLLFFGFWAAFSVSDLASFYKNTKVRLIFALLIIILAIPTQLGLLWQFYSNLPLSKVSNSELAALNFLKSQKSGIVLTAPFNQYERDKYKTPPIPIYAWSDTGYISAFSSKETLISDQEQVNIMGYKVDRLLEDRKKAFESPDDVNMNEFLKKYKIDYIYLSWDQKFATDPALINADIIFQNNEAKVFKVKQ